MKAATVRRRVAGYGWRCALCPGAGLAPTAEEALTEVEEHYAKCHREDA